MAEPFISAFNSERGLAGAADLMLLMMSVSSMYCMEDNEADMC
jgi:hypothetical protein